MSRTSGARLLSLVRANVAKLSHQSLVPGDEQEQRLIVLLLDEGSTDDRGAGPQEQLCGRHLIAGGLTPAARPRGSVDSVFGMPAFLRGQR
jgi:hypothetical protein